MSILRKRTKHLIYAGLTGAAVVGVLFAGYAVIASIRHHSDENKLKEEYRQQIAQIEKAQIEQQKSMKVGWSLTKDIAAGQIIQRNDLTEIRLPVGASPPNLIASGDEIAGKVAKIELLKGTSLTESMLYEEEPTPADIRNKELQAISLPSNLKPGDVIDIRIQFPTGQDFIILSKKKIDRLLAPAMWIRMSEEEILSLSSAMVDAYLHDASLYALTYVEPEMQDKAIATYPVNKEVLKLIESDPNIVNKAEQKLSESVRVALEKDLANLSETHIISGQNFSSSEYSSTYQHAANNAASVPDGAIHDNAASANSNVSPSDLPVTQNSSGASKSLNSAKVDGQQDPVPETSFTLEPSGDPWGSSDIPSDADAGYGG